MNVSDIQKANMLSQEKAAIQTAADYLRRGGRIMVMNVGSPSLPPEDAALITMSVSVPTSYIEYPPQMVTAIQAAFQTRLQAIQDELTTLGVTEMSR